MFLEPESLSLFVIMTKVAVPSLIVPAQSSYFKSMSLCLSQIRHESGNSIKLASPTKLIFALDICLGSRKESIAFYIKWKHRNLR